jgi:hypothetical protein
MIVLLPNNMLHADLLGCVVFQKMGGQANFCACSSFGATYTHQTGEYKLYMQGEQR